MVILTGISYDKEFLGYKYGGDAIVFNVNKKFVRYGKWKFEINSFNMIHGTFNINTLWRTVTSDVFTPTTSNPDADKTDLDAIEYTSVLGFYGDFSLLNTVKPYSQVDFVAIKNKGNVSSSFDFDVQLTVGARINL
ncbi:MAG: hypothetical protein LKE40_15080 [Spirochaetia bacterium]|jgi:hypothetical protein|nr:hypothetical protein [Spirochaetia bacterium]